MRVIEFFRICDVTMIVVISWDGALAHRYLVVHYAIEYYTISSLVASCGYLTDSLALNVERIVLVGFVPADMSNQSRVGVQFLRPGGVDAVRPAVRI